MKKSVKLIVSLLLIAVMTMGFAACGTADDGEPELITVTSGETIGEGNTEFPLDIVDAEGEEISITVKTDQTTVGAALVELGLIAGEDSEYGLYIKTVNGITLDYEQDGMYWAFYIDGTYAMTGVDQTDITEGSSYLLKAE